MHLVFMILFGTCHCQHCINAKKMLRQKLYEKCQSRQFFSEKVYNFSV